jgi:hypothetical protein
MKIRPVGANLFNADGRPDRRIDMTKLIVDLRDFANVPKKKNHIHTNGILRLIFRSPSRHCSTQFIKTAIHKLSHSIAAHCTSHLTQRF